MALRRSAKLALSLRDEPFFQDMPAEAAARIEAFVHHRAFDPRQIIYFPEDPCDHVYWVREGRVRVTRVSKDRRELTFRHLLPGDMLGEECLTERARREDYAEALAATVLCLMRAADFRRLVHEEAALASRVAEWLCRRVRGVETVLAETVFSSVHSRVASGLMRLYRRECGEEAAPLRITHQELANLIGSTRETTTAVLQVFRAAGLISLANRRVTVLDPEALELRASGG